MQKQPQRAHFLLFLFAHAIPYSKIYELLVEFSQEWQNDFLCTQNAHGCARPRKGQKQIVNWILKRDAGIYSNLDEIRQELPRYTQRAWMIICKRLNGSLAY